MATLEFAVRQASDEHVVLVGSTFGKNNKTYPYLDPQSALLNHSVTGSLQEYLDKALTIGPSTQDADELAAFLAVGTCCHALDGWRYLSQAAFALLSGARRTSLHLAYYAELRAARSILASSGIAIRNNWHFVITKNKGIVTFGALSKRPTSQPGLVHNLLNLAGSLRDAVSGWIWQHPSTAPPPPDEPIGTHVAAWKALKEWVGDPDHAERVVRAFNGLEYDGVDWVEACRSSAMRADAAAYWLDHWSCDLKSMASDSAARNIASYGVDLKGDAFSPVQKSELDAVRDANEACLSTGNSTDQIQLMLIHDFAVKSARRLGTKSKDFWEELKQWLENVDGLTPSKSKELVKLIRRMPKTAAGRIFELAQRKNTDARAVFARALLLLRLATALLRTQWQEIRLQSASGATTWQQEWLREFALHAHVDLTASPGGFHDLESDHENALDEIKSWLDSNSFDARKLWQGASTPLRELCRLERIALWAAEP
jgi:hypothetical protein